MIEIRAGGLDQPQVIALRQAHLDDMHATAPAESVHALDASALNAEGVSFFTARDGDVVLGCGALKRLSGDAAEIKSMRTCALARGKGAGTAMLNHLIDVAKCEGIGRLYLETGTAEFFAPARRLYLRRGFVLCGPFADYVEDPHSVFMVLAL
ncbi:MAG: GNAT family N-acetyltransferase [Gammaproteobacteria bacterium]|nr:GNAT family N-acetyltransferase [Gammaproteobacteria bacterium]